MVTRVRSGGHLGAVSAVVHDLRRRAADRAVCTCRVGQGEGVDGEGGGDTDVRRHVDVRPCSGGDVVTPFHEVVARARSGGHLSTVGAIVHGLRRRARDRAVCTCRVGQGEGVDGPLRIDGDICCDVCRGIKCCTTTDCNRVPACKGIAGLGWSCWQCYCSTRGDACYCSRCWSSTLAVKGDGVGGWCWCWSSYCYGASCREATLCGCCSDDCRSCCYWCYYTACNSCYSCITR